MSATSAHDTSPSDELILRLWPRPASCGDARTALRSFCLTHSLEHVSDDAELLASELMTNAIKHAHALITFVAICDDRHLLVNVHDDDSDHDVSAPAPAGETAESGRGLHLVDRIAGSWGTTMHPDGKSVWFRLP